MADKIRKSDLRIKKTNKALYNTLFTMLSRKNFNDITVNDLCSEALVSRAAFYAHFSDKYDLFRYFLSEIKSSIIKDVYNYSELEREVNHFVYENKKVISNVMRYANSETLMLLREFMASIVELSIKREVSDTTNPNHIILFNFSVGGLLNLLTWLVENNFPPEIKIINMYLYKMLEAMTIWDAQQEQAENRSLRQ